MITRITIQIRDGEQDHENVITSSRDLRDYENLKTIVSDVEDFLWDLFVIPDEDED